MLKMKSGHLLPDKAPSSIYFGVVIWGKSFCQVFADYCLFSLLASGNIPALPNLMKKNKFLFCTTAADWEWLQSHPAFILLRQYIIPEFIPIELTPEENYPKYKKLLSHKLYLVTRAHAKLVSRMYQDKCIGSLVFPDTIYAKNSLKSIYLHILQKNTKAVLAHFPRFSTPELLEELEQQDLIKSQQPIEIENRHLIQCALKHRNIELLAQKWDCLYSFDFITEIWWPLNKNGDMLFHSFMWCPVLIDYTKLHSHNIECLEDNTIDGSYLYNNFIKNDLYVITDSDEFLMISFSTHTQLKVKSKIENSSFSTIRKITYWQKMISNLSKSFIDPLKLELLKYPVLVHATDLDKKAALIKKTSQRIVKKILSPLSKQQRLLLYLANSSQLEKLKIKSQPLSQEEILIKNLIEKHSINIV